MKKLFLLGGLVVGHAVVFDSSVSASCAIDGVTVHEVPTDSPITDGWKYTEEDGEYHFAHAPRMNRKPTPIEFKLLFTSAERLAINEKLKDDLALKDIFSILDDQRLKFVDLELQANLDMLAYLVSISVLTDQRSKEIANGFPS